MDKTKLKKLSTFSVLFSVGAIGYMLIELLWRGRTHWSMALAGGICFTIFGQIFESVKKLPKIYIPLVGSLVITFVEFIFGIVFNIILKKNVWDYSHIRFNFLGQICLIFSTLWGLLSILFMPLAGKIRNGVIK